MITMHSTVRLVALAFSVVIVGAWRAVIVGVTTYTVAGATLGAVGGTAGLWAAWRVHRAVAELAEALRPLVPDDDEVT